MTWGRGIVAGVLVALVGLLVAVPASAHVGAPYLSDVPADQAKFDGIMRGKILAAGGAGSDGFYVENVKLPESNLMAQARAGNPSAIKKVRTLTRARKAVGMLPPLRWAGALTLMAGAFQAGWTIGAAADRWLEISADFGIAPHPSITNLTGVAKWEWATVTASWGAPAACTTTGCWRLSIGLNPGGMQSAVKSNCTAAWSACVGFTDTANIVNANAAGWTYMQTIPTGTVYTRTTSVTGGEMTEKVRLLTEAEMEAATTITKYEPKTTQTSQIPGPTGIPNELSPGPNHIAYDRSIARGIITADPDHDAEEWVNGQMDPGYTPPPITMPNCIGQTVAYCSAQLTLLGFEGTLTVGTLTFETADVDLPANAVATQTIPAGGTVPKTGTITIEKNPAEMPIVLPQPLPHETYTAYITRLTDLGWIGTATRVDLPEISMDPSRGPDEVVTTQPKLPGQRIRVDDPVTVRTNPPTAPPPGGLPPADCPCPIPAVDFSPLASISGGDAFPFGLFSFMGDVLGHFNVSPEAPGWSFMLGSDAVGEHAFEWDLEAFSPYMAIVRGLMSVALWIGAVWLLATRLLGFNAGGDLTEAADDGSVI